MWFEPLQEDLYSVLRVGEYGGDCRRGIRQGNLKGAHRKEDHDLECWYGRMGV